MLFLTGSATSESLSQQDTAIMRRNTLKHSSFLEKGAYTRILHKDNPQKKPMQAYARKRICFDKQSVNLYTGPFICKKLNPDGVLEVCPTVVQLVYFEDSLPVLACYVVVLFPTNMFSCFRGTCTLHD